MSHTFGWCVDGFHDQCRRRYQRYYFETLKGTKTRIVWLDDWAECECPKRGCKCYVPKKDRTKSGTRRRKK